MKCHCAMFSKQVPCPHSLVFGVGNKFTSTIK